MTSKLDFLKAAINSINPEIKAIDILNIVPGPSFDSDYNWTDNILTVSIPFPGAFLLSEEELRIQIQNHQIMATNYDFENIVKKGYEGLLKSYTPEAIASSMVKEAHFGRIISDYCRDLKVFRPSDSNVVLNQLMSKLNQPIPKDVFDSLLSSLINFLNSIDVNLPVNPQLIKTNCTDISPKVISSEISKVLPIYKDALAEEFYKVLIE